MKLIEYFLRMPLLQAACLGISLTACSGENEGSTGSLVVLVEAEETITEGIEAGDEVEEIIDGWTASFDKYLTVVGHIDLHYSTDQSLEAEAEELYVVDLTRVTSGGLELWSFDDL